jgi:CheY-like chemotaxis protein
MKLLLVENSPSDAAVLVSACSQLGNVDLDIAVSLEAANDLIQRRHAEYDLAIFDLQIPTTDQALDEHVDHGLAAFVRLGRLAPGTIRFVWSGKTTDEAYEQIVDEQNKADPLGSGQEESMVRFFKKEKVRDCITCLTEISEAMAVLEAMHWSWGLDPQPIASMTRRVIDIFARRQNGVIIHAGALGDGLSDASVFRLEVKADTGATTASVVGKVDGLDAVRDELARYSRHVAAALAPGVYAPLSDEVLVGADGLGGAFYSLVDPEARSLFEVASEDPQKAASAVDRLADKLSPWRQGAPQQQVSVREIRNEMLRDERLDALEVELPFDRAVVEAGEVYVRESVIHGDLHGQNVLVDAQADPILIDYAEVRRGPAALDPVTLELSAMLHPKSPMRGLWDGADAALWAKPSDFFAQSPHRPFFLALRKWAHAVAATDGEVCAAAYAYCIRQMKYDDVDKELAARLAAAAASALP